MLGVVWRCFWMPVRTSASRAWMVGRLGLVTVVLLVGGWGYEGAGGGSGVAGGGRVALSPRHLVTGYVTGRTDAMRRPGHDHYVNEDGGLRAVWLKMKST